MLCHLCTFSFFFGCLPRSPHLSAYLPDLCALLSFTRHNFFFFSSLPFSFADSSAFEIGAFQAVSGEGSGLLPEWRRVLCHRDPERPTQTLQVWLHFLCLRWRKRVRLLFAQERNGITMDGRVYGFRLMTIPCSIFWENDPPVTICQSISVSSFVFNLVSLSLFSRVSFSPSSLCDS